MPKHLMRINLKRCFPSIVALGCITAAWGDTRFDPTMPPAAWWAAQSNAPATTPATATAPAAGTVATQDESSGVQLILIGASRRFALIDGQVVKAGDAYNGSKVVAIKPNEVVTQDPSKSLLLIPGVKKVITSAPTGDQAETSKGKGPAHRSGDGK
jgi:hypothetical protein